MIAEDLVSANFRSPPSAGSFAVSWRWHMLAVIAAVIFFLVAFGVHIGTVNLLALGLAVLALHFVFAWTPWAHRT